MGSGSRDNRTRRHFGKVFERGKGCIDKGFSDINALKTWVSDFGVYLEIKLPGKRELFAEPLNFLSSILDQASKGSSHPILSKKVHSRPVDSLKKQRFKVACVVVGDVFYEMGKNSRLERCFRSKAEADDVICGQLRVQEAGKKFGLSPAPSAIKDWRRQLREAKEGSALKSAEESMRPLFKVILEQFDPKMALLCVINYMTWQRII